MEYDFRIFYKIFTVSFFLLFVLFLHLDDWMSTTCKRLDGCHSEKTRFDAGLLFCTLDVDKIVLFSFAGIHAVHAVCCYWPNAHTTSS